MTKSFLICNKLIFIGNINELRPNTNPTLAMFDPTTFPIAIGDEPRKNIFPDKNTVNEIGYRTNKQVLKFYENN